VAIMQAFYVNEQLSGDFSNSYFEYGWYNENLVCMAVCLTHVLDWSTWTHQQYSLPW